MLLETTLYEQSHKYHLVSCSSIFYVSNTLTQLRKYEDSQTQTPSESDVERNQALNGNNIEKWIKIFKVGRRSTTFVVYKYFLGCLRLV